MILVFCCLGLGLMNINEHIFGHTSVYAVVAVVIVNFACWIVFEIACLHILLNGCVHPYNVWSCSASLLTEYSWNMRNTERTETHTIISLSFSIVKNWMVYRWPCRLCYLFPKRAGSIPSHISIKKFQTTHGHSDLSHQYVHLQLHKT